MALIESHTLRGYDGVQLAAALELNDLISSVGMPVAVGSTLTLVSADDDLNLAAVAEGLTLEDPRSHLDANDKIPYEVHGVSESPSRTHNCTGWRAATRAKAFPASSFSTACTKTITAPATNR